MRERVEHARLVSRDWIAKHANAVRIIAGTAALVALSGGWFIYDVLSDLPNRDQMKALGDAVQGATLYDTHDRRVFTIPTEYRIEVPVAKISSNLKNAMVAVEDMRFYSHDGIDGVRVISAMLEDLRRARAAEGASTITQQLARMSFLTPDKTIRRKIKEAILAQRIERLYSKDEILEFYLNKAYFGNGLYGAEAASRGYFGKPAAQLSLPEGALLAGLVKAPSASNPTVNPDRAMARRNVVLQLMVDQKLIDRAQYRAAIAAPLALTDSLRQEDPAGVHFKEQVRRELVERFGRTTIYEGHLKVYTTIDPMMQKAAEDAVVVTLKEIEPHTKQIHAAKKGAVPQPESGDNRLQAALLALDPASGEVRAIVGGRDTASVGLNRALQSKRQPGSAFKPFVYATALENGYTPASMLSHLDVPVTTYKGAWLPEDEHSTASSMTIRTALRTSSNRAAAKMIDAVGIDRTVAYAKRLGVGTVPSVPSLALGAGDVTLVSMASAYGAFAQKGMVREPIFIRRVEDEDGNLLFEAKPKEQRAISETTAFLMSTMLADVVNTGTGARARTMGFTLPAAGKTGTTNDFMDAWFVGYTPKLLAGVWVGYDEPRTIMPNGFAAGIAVPLWTRFMKVATKNDAKEWFEPPPDVVPVQVCRVSGLLPVAGCRNAASVGPNGDVTNKSMVYTEYFARGTEPTKTCNVHSSSYQPYPEPVIATIGFDNKELGVEPVSPAPPPPLSASPPRATLPQPNAPPAPIPLTAPSAQSPEKLPLLPSAPPEPPPSSAPVPAMQSPGALPALPSAPPEPVPAAPRAP